MGGWAGQHTPLTWPGDRGSAPYIWMISAGALPGGLTISADGVILGAPTASGTFLFTVEVTDAGLATANVSGTINIAPQLTLPLRWRPTVTPQTRIPHRERLHRGARRSPMSQSDPRYAPFGFHEWRSAALCVCGRDRHPSSRQHAERARLERNLYWTGLVRFLRFRLKDSLGAAVVVGIEFLALSHVVEIHRRPGPKPLA